MSTEFRSAGPAGEPGGVSGDLTGAVVESFAGTADPRLRELLGSLTRHLHDFVRETRLTGEEWERAVGFLTATGQACTDTRQEFILLSDVLGVSMLVETVNAAAGPGTESTVLGPFHMTESPVRELGADIDLLGSGEPCVVSGRVLSDDGTPLPGAVLDVWQADTEGFYDVQQPDVQPPGNGRGLFTADGEGRFWFRTCVPDAYPIPTDGPVGDLLRATGRHPYRPAHIHFIADAPGHEPVTTHIFVAGGRYLDSDAVFAVKQSLVQDFTPTDDPVLAREFGVANPFRHARFDLVLNPR
ncbi:dioxygenase [Streptomyces sp. 4F14]|uniref:dioxygenase family protein n=1 Tax=Streptomyces sp. 4F14 TaxID=3394380 RepID=UPI003A89F7EC